MKRLTNILVVTVLVLSGIAKAQFDPRRFLPSSREQTKASETLKTAFRDVLKDAAKSTVRIKGDGKEIAFGTVVDADGWIITKASELSGKLTVILKDGKDYEAKYIGTADGLDLAMLKIEATGLTPIAWAENKSAQVGQWVATPTVTGGTLSVGVISVGRRKIPWQVSRVVMGVMLEDAPGGAKVTSVTPNFGAAKAGILANDVIVRIEDKLISSREELIDNLQLRNVGERIKIVLKRNGKDMELAVDLMGRPGTTQPSRGEIMNTMGGPISDRNSGFPVVIQHDMVLRPFECGGPLVNLDGKAIGINIARAGRVETYTLPADTIVPVLADLKAGKYPPHPKIVVKPTTQPSASQAKMPSTRPSTRPSK